MADIEARATRLEARVDDLDDDVRRALAISASASREACIATRAHQHNIRLLNALRETQTEHGRRLDSIDGTLGKMAVGMHTIETLLRRSLEGD